jgi:hypothetical protein
MSRRPSAVSQCGVTDGDDAMQQFAVRCVGAVRD